MFWREMDDFKKNRCRFCRKMFCCMKCRKRHEEDVHKVNPDCAICISGRTYIEDFTISLLEHMKTTHWPLHCVFCKRVFNTVDELSQHSKCPVKNFAMKSPVTPIEKINEPSPIVTPIIPKHLDTGPENIAVRILMGVTSTPMQIKSSQIDKLTPIDHSDVKSYMFKSSLKLTGSSATLNESRKAERRVTFSDTPVIEGIEKTPTLFAVQKIAVQEDTSAAFIEESMDESFKSIRNDLFDQSLEIPKNTELVPSSVASSVYETALTTLSNRSTPGMKTVARSRIIRLSGISICKEIVISKENVAPSASSLTDSISFAQGLNTSGNKLWTSVTKMVKSVMQNMSLSTSQSVKRTVPDEDDDLIEDSTRFKKMKYTDIRCRKPIRELDTGLPVMNHNMICRPSDVDEVTNILYKPGYVDKATQTDDFLLYS